MSHTEQHDNLRDNIGQAIADYAAEHMDPGGKIGIDWLSSNDIDPLADKIVQIVAQPAEMGEILRKAAKVAGESAAKLMLTAADECDRFYGGMMNWKANAQAKDRTITELREQLAKPAAIRPIRTLDDHAVALAEVQALMTADPKPGTPEGDRLEVLAALVEAYENAHFPISAAAAQPAQAGEAVDADAIFSVLHDCMGGDISRARLRDAAQKVASLAPVSAQQGAAVDAKPYGWVQFIDGQQTQNFARDEAELENVKWVTGLSLKGEHTVEYVQVFDRPEGAAKAPAAQAVPNRISAKWLHAVAQDAGFNLNMLGELVVPSPHHDATPYLRKFAKLLAASPASTPESAPEQQATDAIQFLKNVVADAAPMLSHDWPKTAELLKHAVAQIEAAHAQQPAAPKLLGEVVMYPNYSTVIRWVEGVTPPSGTKLYDGPPTAGAATTSEKPLTHGHRDDWYLLVNARRIGLMPIHQVVRMPNWVLATELFATGSTSAHQICTDAGIDPDATTIHRK
jgi:hypothetical protein